MLLLFFTHCAPFSLTPLHGRSLPDRRKGGGRMVKAATVASYSFPSLRGSRALGAICGITFFFHHLVYVLLPLLLLLRRRRWRLLLLLLLLLPWSEDSIFFFFLLMAIVARWNSGGRIDSDCFCCRCCRSYRDSCRGVLLFFSWSRLFVGYFVCVRVCF